MEGLLLQLPGQGRGPVEEFPVCGQDLLAGCDPSRDPDGYELLPGAFSVHGDHEHRRGLRQSVGRVSRGLQGPGGPDHRISFLEALGEDECASILIPIEVLASKSPGPGILENWLKLDVDFQVDDGVHLQKDQDSREVPGARMCWWTTNPSCE